MICPPGSTPKRPRSGTRRRPRAGWSRPPSARTPGGPTPARSAGSTSGSAAARSTTRPWPPTSPSCTTPDALRRAPRWRSPRRASAQSSPVNLLPPASGPLGSWPATGGPPAIAVAVRHDRSGFRTWLPCSRPATGRVGADAASSQTKSPSSGGGSMRLCAAADALGIEPHVLIASSIEAGINTIGRGTHDGRLRRDGDRRASWTNSSSTCPTP